MFYSLASLEYLTPSTEYLPLFHSILLVNALCVLFLHVVIDVILYVVKDVLLYVLTDVLLLHVVVDVLLYVVIDVLLLYVATDVLHLLVVADVLLYVVMDVLLLQCGDESSSPTCSSLCFPFPFPPYELNNKIWRESWPPQIHCFLVFLFQHLIRTLVSLPRPFFPRVYSSFMIP